MATQVVELTGDEARLLKSLDKLIKKEAEHEKQLDNVGRAGQRVGDKASKSAKKAETTWDRFGKGALATVGGLAGGFLTVGTAVQTVNGFLEDQNQLYKDALASQLGLARSQQEAFKNLAGLSEANRLGLIEGIGDIARQTGFSDFAALTDATGAAVSAGADASSAKSAVTAAARLTVNTPEATAALAAAAIDLQKATGSTDARANLGLLNLAGTQARVVDPLALAQSLAPALVSTVSTVPGQDKGEASRQAAALFASLSKQTADSTGKSTSTATTQFTAELGKFFGDLEQQRIDARSKIQKLDGAKSTTEAQRTERARLQSFLNDAEGLSDSGTLFGRIGALQQNEGLRSQFFSREFGEVAFKGAFKALADSSSDIAKELGSEFETIQLSPAAFERIAAEASGGTSVLRTANIQSRLNAGSEGARIDNNLGALRGLVREGLDKQLSETTPATFTGLLQSLSLGTTAGNLQGSSVAAEAGTALQQLVQRQGALRAGGITAENQPKLEQTAVALGAFKDSLTQAVRLQPESLAEVRQQFAFNAGQGPNAQTLGPNGELVSTGWDEFFAEVLKAATVAAVEGQKEREDRLAAAMEESNAIQREQLNAANATANNTQPETPNYGNLQRGRDQ